MGYYTNFTLSHDGDNSLDGAIETHIHAISGYEVRVDCETDGWKWYSHEKDMATLSRNFPDIRFTLDCRGEDGEIWRVYAFDGKSKTVHPTIIFPEFSVE